MCIVFTGRGQITWNASGFNCLCFDADGGGEGFTRSSARTCVVEACVVSQAEALAPAFSPYRSYSTCTAGLEEAPDPNQ